VRIINQHLKQLSWEAIVKKIGKKLAIDRARENLAVELSESDCLGSRKETEYIGLLPPGLFL
jgi:hypothetical protein